MSLNKYTPIDLLFVAYTLILNIILLFFHSGVENWVGYILLHTAMIAAVIILIPILSSSENRFFQFIRWWYPLILFTFNYKEINAFTHLLYPGWRDAAIASFEKGLLGFHPSVWLEKFVSPPITELMKFDYFTYYLMVQVGAAVIYLTQNRAAFTRYVATLCVAFYISYLGFIIYPVRGPRYQLYDKYSKDYVVNVKEFYGDMVEADVAPRNTRALKGYVFTSLQDYIMRYGSLHGGCMPSSHVAVAIICMAMMFIYRRKLFYVYFPLVGLLCIAVVYNRYHYVSDVFAGIVVAVISLWLTPLLLRGWKIVEKNY